MKAIVQSTLRILVAGALGVIPALLALPASAQEGNAQSAERLQVRSFALASGDFDRDGWPDLAAAYATPDGGAVRVRRGSSGALALARSFPRTRVQRLRDASEAAWQVPVVPTWLETADVDADGRADLVMAENGGEEILWLPGDARGGFGSARRVGLPGRITAIAAGEVNRADGLIDLVVAITGRGGPEVLVFESPRGAVRGEPEALLLADEATALAIGQFDESYEMDLAVATRGGLIVVSGRDRRLSAYVERQETVAPPSVHPVPLPAIPIAMAAGDFGGDWRTDLAVLFEDGTVSVLEQSSRPRSGAGELGGDASRRRLAPLWRERHAVQVADPEWLTVSVQLPRLARMKGAASPKDAFVVVNPLDRRLEIVRVAQDGTGSEVRLEQVDLAVEPGAVLPIPLDADGSSDLVILQRDHGLVAVVARQVVRSFVINSTGDESDPNLGTALDDRLCDVDLATAGEQCTLRAALENAIETTREAQFTFDLGGESTIAITSPLPPLLGMVTMDGTIPGSAITRVTLDGSAAGDGANGLELRGGDSVVRNLRVTGFSGHGFLLSGTPPPGAGRHLLEDCASDSNGGHGVMIEGGTPGNIIQRCEIAFNGADGVHIALPETPDVPGGSNLITANPSISSNGGHGVMNDGTPANVVSSNNVSRNGDDGVHNKGTGAQANLVQGNSVGTAGSNGGDAVVNDDATETTIGGAAAGQGNRLAGDNRGVRLEGGLLSGIQITGNLLDEDQNGATFSVGILGLKTGRLLNVDGNLFLELDDDGAGLKANLDAGTIYNFRRNRFETTMQLGGELIVEEGLSLTLNYAGNHHVDNDLAMRLVESKGDVKLTISDFHVQGGTGMEMMLKASGEKTLEGWEVRGGASVKVVADLDADVRATVMGEGILIANSNEDALSASFTGRGDLGFALFNTMVQDAKKDGFRFDVFGGLGAQVVVDLSDVRMDGLKALGTAGLRFSNRSTSIDIFRVDMETVDFKEFDTNIFLLDIQLGDTITGCTLSDGGVGILLDGATEATVSGCTISGHTLAGVLAQGESAATLTGNVLTGNGTAAIIASTGPGVEMAANSVFGNTGLGIDLGNDGVTPNDPGDADSGPNGLQNFPVLTSVSASSGGARVLGFLESASNAAFTVELFDNAACDSTGFGEGEVFLAATDVTTDGDGRASFDVTLSGSPPRVVTATATDAAGRSSEFSRCEPADGGDVTPREAIVSLIGEVRSSELQAGTENSLVVQLTAALASIDRGNARAAIHQLNAFTQLVRAQTGKKIPAQKADQWIAAALQIIESLQVS